MRFVFLGTGTSSGVPAIGCGCGVCTSTDPRDNRLRCSAAVHFRDAGGRERTVLIDTSPDLRQQALRFGLRRCDAILYTHHHVDHVFGLDEVRRFNALQGGVIEVYADDRTMDALERVYRHIFDRARNVNDSFVASLMPRRITPGEIEAGAGLEVFGLRCTPIPLMHGKLPILGYRLEAGPGVEDAGGLLPLAYCTDASGVPPESWGRLAGVRTLVLDALRHRSHPTHLTVSQAVGIAERVGADRTYFVHMSHDLGHEETERGLPGGMRLAWDGLTLP